MDKRIKIYNLLHENIKNISTNKLNNIFNAGKTSTGYGVNSVAHIDKIPVFIKKIPCTQLEYNNIFDTSNLYNIPTVYNYGFGSFGINCFRELLMHIKTSKWVINKEIENFPIMYHYRFIPTQSIIKNKIDVKYWNNDKNIKNYLREKNKAPYEIMIFLEYFPNVLYKWLRDDINNIYSFEKQAIKILSFLKKNNIIHLDGHSGNFVVSKNGLVCLTDFGLVMDMDFKLSKREIDFYNKNTYYQFGLSLMIIINPLIWNSIYTQSKEDQQWFNQKYDFKNHNGIEKRKIVYSNLDEICKYLKYDSKYKKMILKYKDLELTMTTFIKHMDKNTKKDIPFPNNKIKKLLHFTI